MPSKPLFVYTIPLLSSLILVIKADPTTLLSVDCPNTTLATTSTYQTNLNTLLSVLSSHSTNASNGFYNFTAGTSPPDVAYGLFLCRGDVAADECRDCVVNATGHAVEQCPRSKRVTIWYEKCLLRRAKRKYNSLREKNVGDDISTVQSLQYDLGPIKAATNNFSDDNKIGEGGFGPVYKPAFLGRSKTRLNRFTELESDQSTSKSKPIQNEASITELERR
ncbi:hypothetical protein RHGRI_014877 [Rhododendron griersonianum]|uniref:Gnk2-homologous domain-containing protein n=1 Tax=Rhododendron griersonianum TaxID=479676 RepID=A0AAV6KB77_9ERIC|nr:hypothetical protein RHGRI_014877 [Rhododendron griersonianum]